MRGTSCAGPSTVERAFSPGRIRVAQLNGRDLAQGIGIELDLRRRDIFLELRH